MRKLLILLGLVLGIGWGGTALAQSGSDSSGTHSYSLDCVGEDLVFTNTGEGKLMIILSLAMGQPGYTVNAGESKNFGVPGVDTGPVGTRFEVWFADPAGSDQFYGMDEGNFPDCTVQVPDEAPELLSECRVSDWYLVHPDGNWAYRMSTGDILYDADYTSNNPAAVYGEVLIPAGVNEVGYADDFNVAHTATRPAECGGPTPSTTAPTTTQPTDPTTPTPNTPGLDPVSGEGFVAPGAEIGPGQATFGATRFAPGEEVGVTLFSTPRSLGTVTADDAGAVSITFEVLASDGAGEHHVVFTGPSGSVSIPFTLVLPAGAAAPTTVAGQLPVTR